MTFEQIVQDAEHFPDNLQWQLNDGTALSLGEIRNKIRAYDQGFTQKTQQLAQQRQEFQRQQQELANAYALFQQQVQEFQTKQQATPANQAAQLTGDIFSEPGDYFKPLVERINGYDQRYKAYEDRLNQIFELARDSISWVADRETEKDYKSAREAFKDFWEDSLTPEELKKYAHENKITDKRGFPLVRDAAERYFAPKLREKEIADAEKRGAEKAARERPSAPRIPRPTSAEPGAAPQKNYGGDLGAFFKDMRADPDVNNNLATMFGYQG